MASPLKFGLVVLAGAGLLLAAPGWAQRGGGHGGGMAGGGHFGGGMARAPMSSAPRMAPRGMARPAPRMTGAPMISRQMAFRARTAAVVRTSRPAARASANRRAVVSYRMRRDRFGHLHRVRVVSFVGGFGYPGYYGYPYDDYGLDSLDYDTGQNSYAAAPEAVPAADQYAAGDQYPAAPAPSAAAGPPADASVPDAGQLILVRKDGQIVTPNAFAITGDQLVYITRQGAKLSFPVADLDKDTTRKMNAANGTNIAIPD